jgi:hypothetical protein
MTRMPAAFPARKTLFRLGSRAGAWAWDIAPAALAGAPYAVRPHRLRDVSNGDSYPKLSEVYHGEWRQGALERCRS